MEPLEAFSISEHASLTYEQVALNGEPVDPMTEERPDIPLGERRMTVKIKPADGGAVKSEEVYIKRVGKDCCRVYRRLESKRSVKKSDRNLQHGGNMYFALRLERIKGIEDEIYEEPEEDDGLEHLVAIKKQSLSKIEQALSAGHHENPYTAIRRMQTIGDDIHVLSCVEALKDKKNLYTIMPYCEGSIESLNDGSEEKARSSIKKVWKNLHYLQKHGIVHHDLSPDNIMSYRGNLVLIDLAMSLIIPGDPSQRPLLRPQGTYGKLEFMTPEVFFCISTPPPFDPALSFDGFALDVWASGCILYCLLTKYCLFSRPYHNDIMFRYFIMAKGLSNEPLNERTVEILIDVFQNCNDEADRQSLLIRAMAHVSKSAASINLLQKMLGLVPADRYTLAQCIESGWARGELLLER
mmetsp:Transcript_32609/g.49140  ORF Transcript_32609/g.49140 Transcript_32609/m.49140 type:complete len:410 (+) Transcript_32609:56-1285(+)